MRPLYRPARPVDVATAKGILEQAATRVASARLRYEATAAREGVEHPGRIAAVVAIATDGSERPIGRVGELHPRLLEGYEVRASHVVFAEIDLQALLGAAPGRKRVGRLELRRSVTRTVVLRTIKTAQALQNLAAELNVESRRAGRQRRGETKGRGLGFFVQRHRRGMRLAGGVRRYRGDVEVDGVDDDFRRRRLDLQIDLLFSREVPVVQIDVDAQVVAHRQDIF